MHTSDSVFACVKLCVALGPRTNDLQLSEQWWLTAFLRDTAVGSIFHMFLSRFPLLLFSYSFLLLRLLPRTAGADLGVCCTAMSQWLASGPLICLCYCCHFTRSTFITPWQIEEGVNNSSASKQTKRYVQTHQSLVQWSVSPVGMLWIQSNSSPKKVKLLSV